MSKRIAQRLFALTLALLVGGGLLFATGAQEPDSASDLEEIGFNPSGYPIVDEPTSVRILARNFSPISDFIENDFTEWYEEYTNVAIDWDLVADSEVGTKISVVLASGDLPEAFMVPWGISQTQQMAYGAQGVFLPINDYIEPYGPHMQKMLDEYPLMRDLITMPDGNIYAMPNTDDFYEGRLPHKLWIWQPWLDAVGMDVPTTTDEFAAILTAFAEDDPNGNGTADEIPISGNLAGNTATFVPFIMNSFVYAGGDNYTYLNDGQVEVAYVQSEWREGLAYMATLYDAGLIAPEAFTQDANGFRQTNAEETLVGAFTDLAPWRAFPELYANDRWTGWTPVPPLEGPTGMRVATYSPYAIGWFDGLILTSEARYPEVIFRWGEGMYEEEVTLRKYYGRPDQEWRYAEPGEVGINGKPAIWASLAASGGEVDVPTEHSWMHVGPHYRSADFRNGQVVAGGIEGHPQASLYQYTVETGTPYAQDVEKVVPPLVFDESQATEVAGLQTSILNYVNEMIARFVTGDLDISTDWEDYLAEFEALNVDRYVEILQAAYTAKYE